MPPVWPPADPPGGDSIQRIIERVDADARDFKTIKAAEQIAEHILKRWNEKKFHVAEYFLDWVKVKPEEECLWYQGRGWSYRQMNEISNRFFHFARDRLGMKPNAMSAMLLQNCPEFLFIQVGLAKLKVAQAWLNHNLRGASLFGCMEIAGPEMLIFETSMGGHVLEILDSILKRPNPVKLVLWDNEGGGEKIIEEIRRRGGVCEMITEASLGAYSAAEPDAAIRREGTTKEETMALIFTSGTTGLPKATNIPFSRASSAHLAWICAGLFNQQDRFYQCLPLFHSSGQIGVTISWILGIPLIVSRKFSARGFFKEAADSGATVFQYIGELGRYLLSAPPGEYDRKHRIRGGLGNGMRADVWHEFKGRFGIPHLFEFYGATDGNILVFQDNTPDSPPAAVGSCGFIGPLYDQLVGNFRLVKWDVETELPARDAEGYCIPCAWGEPGEYIGRIDPAEKSKLGVSNWSGYYNNKSATDKKVLHDCFEKGDMWLRQGDLLRREYPGWLYFVDRIGDTFRWKGENVSTTEVATFLGEHPSILEANVYGVKIGDMDGRAGMAVVVLEPEAASQMDKTMDQVGRHVAEKLPHYAVPKFVRVTKEIEVTATHKNRKVEYQKLGFDPKVIPDPVFWFDAEKNTYARFGDKEFRMVMAGKAKL